MSDFFRGKKILITGGLGFLGGFVTDELLKKGAIVSVTSISGKKRTGIRILKGDLRDPSFAMRALKGQNVVFHLAALKVNSQYHATNPLKILTENLKLSISVAEAAAKTRPSKIIYLSSTLAGQEPILPYASYGIAKKASENVFEALFHETGIETVIVRFPNTFGPRDNFDPLTGQVIPALISKIYAAGHTLDLMSDKNQRMNFAYAPNAAKTLVSIGAKFRGLELIEVQGSDITFGKVVEVISKTAKKKLDFHFSNKKKIHSGAEHFSKKIRLNSDILKCIRETTLWYENYGK